MKPLSARNDSRAVIRWCLVLYLLMFLVRFLFSLAHPQGLGFSTPDAERYYYSGLWFAQTGKICYPVPVESAWIMPGISVLIGALAKLFQEEAALLWAIRICWILIGSLAPVYLFRSVKLFAPTVYAVLAASVYLLPWYVEYDCYVVTEGPAFAFFTVALYYGLAMGKDPLDFRNAGLFSLFLILSIYFRASGLLLLPAILIWQLVCRKAPLRVQLRNAAAVCLALTVALLPWVIRNAQVFRNFIPLTYTTGDLVYEGSFWGEGYPDDEEFAAYAGDFDPEAEVLREHPELFDADGKPIDDSAEQYITHLMSSIIGKRRLRLWFTLRPGLFLKTQLFSKPRSLLNDTWYWDQVYGISLRTAVRLRQINLLLCLLAGLLSLLRRKLRSPVWFLGLTYVVNLYLVASALPLDRYGQAIMPYRLVLGAIGVYLTADFLKSKVKGKKPRVLPD